MLAKQKILHAESMLQGGAEISYAPGKTMEDGAPTLKGEPSEDTTAVLERWFENHNIVVLTGKRSGNLNLFDIDIQGYMGMKTVVDIVEALGLHRVTLVTTPSGGYHIWFRSEEPLKTCRINYTETESDAGIIDVVSYITLFANSASEKFPSYGVYPPAQTEKGVYSRMSFSNYLGGAVPTDILRELMPQLAEYEFHSEYDPSPWNSYTPSFEPDWI